MYGQGNVYSFIQKYSPMRNKDRHRETLSCPKNNGLTHGVDLCALTRSVTTWLIAPAAITYKSSNQDSETGHKIVIGGAPTGKHFSDHSGENPHGG